MTEHAIQQQLHALEAATKNALKSKESALRFLIDARIIDKASVSKSSSKSVKKK